MTKGKARRLMTQDGSSVSFAAIVQKADALVLVDCYLGYLLSQAEVS
ncbi:hypothetical protein [Shewanella holmiensis]|uniref:Uncharacterized protein n=1 Tax=Shewanella holmiensis TaxID=2952222 RepID=A0A9X2WMT7_9GAMM|nr:hypothetical protein [Shewanella holmiensis]MCT7942253.1 hypothetical protein [Shewanella holmiensis]